MLGRAIRYLAYGIFFLVVCFLWPREMDGFMPGRDGSLTVPENAMVNARYVSVKEGKVEMDAFAKEAIYHTTYNRMDAKFITAHFFNEKNEKTDAFADKGFFNMSTRQLYVLDNVRSVSPDGFEVRSREATYDLNTKKMKAEYAVEGESADKSMQFWSNSAHGSVETNVLDLVGDARVNLKDKRRGLTKARGDTAHMERDKSQVTFQNNVKVEQATTTATSNIAHLFYDNKDRTLRYMSLLEDVKIEEADGKHTRSQVAEFFAPTDTIVLSGFPSVYRGDDVVTGDRITLYRATGVVEVTATNAAMRPESPAEKRKSKTELTPEDEELIP